MALDSAAAGVARTVVAGGISGCGLERAERNETTG
jgi:hypothetical protein